MAPGDGRQVLLVPLGKSIGGDDHVFLCCLLQKAGTYETIVAMMHQDPQAGGKTLQLLLPVAGHGHGADEKSWLKGVFAPIYVLSFPQEKSYQLHGLSQAHIVCQTGSQTYAVQVFQPGDAP